MRFNMGCGRRLDGYVNVDAESGAEADQVFDLEQTPWPWPDSCATEIRFIHALEHMGGAPKVFLAIMREIYRIAAPGCEVVIVVPHPRHDSFFSDPTHVRPIGPDTLKLFDKRLNDEWAAGGIPNTPLAHYLGVDFAMSRNTTVIAEPFASQRERGEIDDAEVAKLVRFQNNVAIEHGFVLVARMPLREV